MKNIHVPHSHTPPDLLAKLNKQLNKTEKFSAAAELFNQLGDKTRIRIFWLLCHTEECVINISALMDISSPAVSHHLRILRQCRLIAAERNGKEVYYRAAENEKTRLLRAVLEQILAFCDI